MRILTLFVYSLVIVVTSSAAPPPLYQPPVRSFFIFSSHAQEIMVLATQQSNLNGTHKHSHPRPYTNVKPPVPNLRPRSPPRRLPKRLQHLCRPRRQHASPLRHPGPGPALRVRDDCQRELAGRLPADGSFRLAAELAERGHEMRLGLQLLLDTG